MDVKEAVKKAIDHVKEMFASENILHVGLEEVVFDDSGNAWRVTVGFFRAWDAIRGVGELLEGKRDFTAWKRRSYKVVEIDDKTGKVLSLTHRSLEIAPD